MECIYKWWGLRVKVLRKAQNLTQRDLATQIGLPRVTQRTISYIERGERAPSLELALALARVLGTSVEVLFRDPLDESEQEAA